MTPMLSVLFDSISIQEDEAVGVRAVVSATSAVLLHRILNDLETVTTTANAYIEMQAKSWFIAKEAQPPRKGSLALALRTDEDTSSPRDHSPWDHPSAEGRHPAHDATPILFL